MYDRPTSAQSLSSSRRSIAPAPRPEVSEKSHRRDPDEHHADGTQRMIAAEIPDHEKG